MDDLRELFELTAALAADFYETLADRPGSATNVVPADSHGRMLTSELRSAAA